MREISSGTLTVDSLKVAILAAQIDEAHFGTDSQAGDDDSLDDRVGVVLEDEAVFAGAGFAFVSVDQDVFRFCGLLGDERPFHSGREPGAAAAAQVGGLHLGNDAVRAEFDGLACGFVSIQLEVLVNVGRTLAKAVRDHLDFIWMGDEIGHVFSGCLDRQFAAGPIVGEDFIHRVRG